MTVKSITLFPEIFTNLAKGGKGLSQAKWLNQWRIRQITHASVEYGSGWRPSSNTVLSVPAPHWNPHESSSVSAWRGTTRTGKTSSWPRPNNKSPNKQGMAEYRSRLPLDAPLGSRIAAQAARKKKHCKCESTPLILESSNLSTRSWSSLWFIQLSPHWTRRSSVTLTTKTRQQIIVRRN